jgi:peptide/nickel transport system substrate-binding protein
MQRKPLAVIGAIGVGAALVLTGCSGGGGAPEDTGSSGGTLEIVGTADIDHLDPTGAALVVTSNLMRAVSRQLVSYKASLDDAERVVAEGDLATEVPEPTDDGLTYTFTLRDGAQWDAPDGARQITSEDVARGIERICNPILPAASMSYFSVIDGFDEFCAGYPTDAPTAESIKEYIESNSISGIETPDDKTVVFTLKEPASDFQYMLSLNAATPVPVEVLDYEPDSVEYRENFISSGPYTVDSYTPDKELKLKRNPAWNADSDTLRQANVDAIDITFGVSTDSAIQQLQSGDADMTYDITIPPAILQQLQTAGDDKLVSINPGGSDFLWINTLSQNNGGALADVKVRQALEYAVDKAALVQQNGGEQTTAVATGVLGDGILGYAKSDQYSTPDDAGDPEKAKQLLAEAGYPDGIDLALAFSNANATPDWAATIQEAYKKAGINVTLKPIEASDYYASFMTNHETAQNSEWDIAIAGWNPDWAGGAARSVFQPQFTFNGTPQTYNYLDYNNDKANEFAAQALTAATAEESADLWHQASEEVMKDAVVVPLISRKAVIYHSDAVGNFLPFALGAQGDWTNVTIDR